MSSIVIDVRATHAHSGKTTITALINKALQDAGLGNVLIACLDNDIRSKIDNLDEALTAVRGKNHTFYLRDVNDRIVDPLTDKPSKFASTEDVVTELSRLGNRMVDNTVNRGRIDQLVKSLSTVVDENDYVMIDREKLTEIEELLEDLYVQERLDITADVILNDSGEPCPPHVGEIILEDILEPTGQTVAQLAEKLECDTGYLQTVVDTKLPISSVVALQLEKAGYSTARVWLEAQHKRNLHEAAMLAQQEAGTFVPSSDHEGE